MQLGRGVCVVFVGVVCGSALAQDRITSQIDPNRTVRLAGQVHPLARAQYDRGPVDRGLPLDMITLLLKPSQTQQLALDQLLANQQNASSPDFHRWLTPEQFADRFGASPGDVAKIRTWLESQGLQINAVARGRGWITFRGTAARVAAAFQTEFRRYVVNGESHFANATEPSIPEAFAALIGGMNGLNDFGPENGSVNSKKVVSPKFEAGGFHFLSPADIATIYNIKPLHDAGIDGSGQSIVIIGASDVDPVDLFLFRALFQLPLNSPTMVLVGKDPGTNDVLSEADLDLEWAGAVAPNAALTYVYGADIFAAAQHAVDQNLAPIISMSFASCEREITPGYRSVIQQASAQGITWVTGSGDAGAAGCDRNSYVSEATRGLSTTFPASVPEVTAVGGTTFAEGSGNYWAASSASNGGSALSYIPETAWNDTAGLNFLLGSGGGPSVLFSKPAWQYGPGVPNDGARDVPDLALAASPDHDAYLMFSGGNIVLSGGTSVGTPEFAGMLALLNQSLSQGAQTPSRLGNINPALYRLAQTSPDIFHDITTGDNIVPCAQGSPDCTTGSFGYSAGPGYDLVTGLGSLDVNKFVTEWAAATSTASSTTRVAATPKSIGFYAGSVQLTATVSGAAGGTPTGSVAFVVNDVNLGSADLAGGSASVTVDASRIGLGNPSVTAIYSGDSNFSGSSGSVAMTVAPPAGAAIAVSVSPNPVYQEHPNPNGFTWFFTIRLTEEAGVAATITSFSVGASKLSVTGFFGTATIPANGNVSASLESRNINAPTTQVFLIAGTDANGQSWSQQVSVQFLGTTLVSPGIKLASTPSTVFENPSADPSCQWSQQLTVEEVGGYTLELTKLTAGNADLSSQLQKIFGTTRLAPYGSLMGTACFAGLSPPVVQSYELSATTDQGGTVGATLSASFAGSAISPPTPTVSPSSVAIQAGAGSSVDGTLAISFGGAPTAWTVSLLPDRAAGWLTVSPLSGAGAAQLNIHASGAALENGVYWATLVVQAVNALPQYINVPVTFVVGASTSTQIAGVSNGASYKTAFAPGMVMSVFGSQLAPSGTAASAAVLPLPLSVAGVSATVNGVAAPLYYVSPGQLNVQIPYETGAGPAVVGVNNNGQVASFPLQVAIAAPGIFVDGNGAIVPAGTGKAGDTLSLFITGDGDLTPTLPTGNTPLPSTTTADLPQPRQPVTVLVGGLPANIQFIGVPAELAGVTQINFTVPQNVGQGRQPVVVSVGGVQSQAALLTITQ
jgi:uncharacterized protein (TIGR03437 family)